jgi:replicative DNA helicase
MTTSIHPDLLMNKAAEGATLASMILDPACVPAVLELLTVESFTFTEHKALFETIVSVWRRNPGGALDGVLLRSELEAERKLEDAGGLDYLRELIESVPTVANARYYARQVLERQRFREVHAAVESMKETLAEGGPVDEIVQHVQGLAMGLECRSREQNVFHVKDHAENVAVETQDIRPMVRTGFENVDRRIAGLSPGDLLYIAARPSVGKTAFACGCALNMAKEGKRVLFFTLEMSAKSLMERMAATLGQVPLATILARQAPQVTLDDFYAGAIELAKRPITVIENAETVERIRSHLRQAKQAGPVDAVFIDYIGLMSPSESRNRTRNDQLTELSRDMKRLAQSERVAVVALSQLNRAVEGREGHRPRLSDLRDSGSLEQDADVVMLLHREDCYRRQADPQAKGDGLAEVNIAKNRNGPTGTAQLVYLADQLRFANLSPAEESA